MQSSGNKPHDLQPTTGIVRLVNPHGALWRSEAPAFDPTPLAHACGPTPPKNGTEARTPLIFIHGMEYYSRQEIIRDLIAPFEAQAQCFRRDDQAPYDIYLLHWDSRLDTSSTSPLFNQGPYAAYPRYKKIWNATMTFSKRVLQWRTDLAMIEDRAKLAARSFSPAMGDLLGHAWPKPPLVVSHSLGSLVWSEIVKQLALFGHLPGRLGTWWNMQPALPWNAFNTGEEYECVAKIYGNPKSHMSIWYSQMDIVLSTAFLGAKRCRAMGQIGSENHSFEHCNVTKLAREAHGQTILLKSAGPFFTRIGSYLRQRAAFVMS